MATCNGEGSICSPCWSRKVYQRTIRCNISDLADRLKQSKSRALVDPDDFVALTNDHGLLGVGACTNHAGLQELLKCSFVPETLSVVTDPFRYSQPLGQTLSIRHGHVLLDEGAFTGRRVVTRYRSYNSRPHTPKIGQDEFIDYLQSQLRLRVVHSTLDTTERQQSTRHILMVAPSCFEFNLQACSDNHFMHCEDAPSPEEAVLTVRDQYMHLYEQLVSAGVFVHLFTHDYEHGTPDACFPNNWFSTHASGECVGSLSGARVLCTYPMKVPNRRQERRDDIIEYIRNFGDYSHMLDLTAMEEKRVYLEGTGSLVLDRVNRVAYACLAERTSKQLAEQWAHDLGYELCFFCASDDHGCAIYHTNVMMAVGTHIAVICSAAIATEDRDRVLRALGETHTVVEISMEQLLKFCGNIIEVRTRNMRPAFVMSTQAFEAFRSDQLDLLQMGDTQLIHADVSMLEKLGGGGVRCTIAELFL
eukprot:Rmarinus@m.17435